jgi:hypothetical protein
MNADIVAIFHQGNDINCYVIPLEKYPTEKVPCVGDKICLKAERVTSYYVGGVEQISADVHLDGEATVLDVWAGSGDQLHPNGRSPYYSFNKHARGYGVRVHWDGRGCPPGVEQIHAEILSGM